MRRLLIHEEVQWVRPTHNALAVYGRCHCYADWLRSSVLDLRQKSSLLPPPVGYKSRMRTSGRGSRRRRGCSSAAPAGGSGGSTNGIPARSALFCILMSRVTSTTGECGCSRTISRKPQEDGRPRSAREAAAGVVRRRG